MERKTRLKRKHGCDGVVHRMPQRLAGFRSIRTNRVVCLLLLLLLLGLASNALVTRFGASSFVISTRGSESRRVSSPLSFHALSGILECQSGTRSKPLAMVSASTSEAPTNNATTTNNIPKSTDNETSNAREPPVVSDLEALGWKPHFADQLVHGRETDEIDTGASATRLLPMRITEVRTKSIHVVGEGGKDHLISITKGQKVTNHNEEKVVVAGDWVLVEPVDVRSAPEDESDGENNNSNTDEVALRLHTILNRQSYLQRKAPGRKVRKKQLIASNLDTVFVVSSCNQDFNVARLERYIATVFEAQNVAPVIVLTKKDLLTELDGVELDEEGDFGDDDFEKDDDFEDDEGMGDQDASSWLLDYYTDQARSVAGGSVPVVCLDARNGTEAAELLAPWLAEGQTVAFVGSSGVGKSTLVNSLSGTTVAKTGAIHDDSGQGRHTTTRRQLHFVNAHKDSASGSGLGCAILDTPGLRELQLVDVAQGLQSVFMDLVDLSKSCKFNDCTCLEDPGCAVTAAVDEGAIELDRVLRWKKLVAEDRANTKDVAEGKRERERKKNRRNQQKSGKPPQPRWEDDEDVPRRKWKR